MLEMRYIRENADKVREYLKNRNSDFDLDSLLKFDEDRRNLLQEVEMLKKERNESSALIGKYKQEGKDPAELLARMQTVSAKIKELDQKVAEIDNKILLKLEEKKAILSVPVSRAEFKISLEKMFTERGEFTQQ